MLPDNDALVQVIKLRPEILQQMLQVIYLFELCLPNERIIKCADNLSEYFYIFITDGVKYHNV